ncbi:10767_t:CDS:2 [Paraglomus brasilianum]|uniref:10767_t:CDS:1 n=1 Tax=Paraglomus brasilianum TaxID=144538 RepID=A0A9N9D8N8_9GLOM|nr:10767_t:CDS:2 [Paraglomus brasilianum]
MKHKPTFFEEVPHDNRVHLEDVDATPIHHNSNITTNTTLLPSFTYLVYLHRSVRNLLFSLIFDWNMVFMHPLNFLILVTVFPAFMIGLVVIGLSLHLGYSLGMGKAIKKIGDKWGGGLSPVNWWDPRIFSDEVSSIVNNAIQAMDEPQHIPSDSVPGAKLPSVQPKTFNIDIAEFLLFVSALIYERDDNIVHEAHEQMSAFKLDPALRTPESYQQINLKLRDSEKFIHDQAHKWGLQFISLSELNSLGGPFAGMFWSLQHNFIIVAFKGTTPTNVEDFLVDALFQRCDARPFLFGDVHEGFYTSLFPESHASARSGSASPYFTIMKGIKAKALEIKQAMEKMNPPKKDPVNIWITGHSLGAGLATLFYSRLLLSPKDLGPNAILRDAYLIGTPAVGDSDFAAQFAAHSSRPYDRHNTLWRIIDDIDIITKLPPGFNNPYISQHISKNNILNYAHVGEGIRFFQDGRLPQATRNVFTSGNEAVIVEKAKSNGFALKGLFTFNSLWNGIKEPLNGISGDDADDDDHVKRRLRNLRDIADGKPFVHKPESPLCLVEKVLPTFFRNHLPARYFQAMQRARVYFDEDAKGSQGLKKDVLTN